MNSTGFNESENGLQSQFAVLRALPLTSRRALLPGLTARYFFGRSAVSLGPILFPLAFLLLLIPFFLVVGVMSIMGFNNQQPKRVSAVARVLQIERINDTQSSGVTQSTTPQWHFIKYRFESDGRTYQNTSLATNTVADRTDYSKIKTDDQLTITYPANNPSRSGLQPLREDREFPPALYLIFPFFISLFFVPIIGPTLRTWWQARRLIQTGQLCSGRVLWISTPMAFGTGIGEFRVHYEFFANGETQTGQMRCNNLWLVQHLPPHAPIVVAYDMAQPKRSIFLEPFVA